jgi:hypothetical protein
MLTPTTRRALGAVSVVPERMPATEDEAKNLVRRMNTATRLAREDADREHAAAMREMERQGRDIEAAIPTMRALASKASPGGPRVRAAADHGWRNVFSDMKRARRLGGTA